MKPWTEQHAFVPRRKGSKLACEVCGARREDPVHNVPHQPKETTR